jgi:hypothetical protein
MPLKLTITNAEKVHVKLNPLTATQRPAALDGQPTWAVTQGAGTVEPDADGLGAFIVSPDTVDGINTIVTVTADADLGAGVITLTDVIEVTVTAEQAVALGLVSDPAVPK